MRTPVSKNILKCFQSPVLSALSFCSLETVASLMSEMKDVRRCRLDENNRLSLRFGKTMGKGNGGGGEGEKRKEKMEKKKMVSQTSPVTLRHHRPVTPPLPPRLRKTQSCFPSTYVMIISGVVNKRFRKKNMVRTVRRTDRF